MALAEQLPPPPSWVRQQWPQHHSNTGDYMMDSGMMSYEPRPMTTTTTPTTAISRPGLSSQYFSSTPFSLAPITTSVPAPQYQPPVSYTTSYQSYSPSPILGSPFRGNHLQAHTRPISVEPGSHRGPGTPRAVPVSVLADHSPSVKAEQQASTPTSITTSIPEPVKIIVSNVPLAGVEAHEFHTPLDNLMKAVQANGTEGLEKKTEAKHYHEDSEQVRAMSEQLPSPPPQREESKTPKGHPAISKPFHCGIAGCDKRFAQKTHLDIHQRAHTGESPYICTACGKGFTQPGNLKAHWRRHTGEKPFKCTLCDKRFPQKGNLQAHMKSHDKTRPFVCMLDDCNKRFSVRGNLKSHQNKFHEESIKRLTARFATISNWDSASSEDKEMFQYLATLYKNSNKGIKGRGKRRNVALLAPSHSQQPSPPLSPESPSHGLPSMARPLAPHPHQLHPYHGISQPSAYTMSRPPALMTSSIRRMHPSGYAMYDTDDGSVSSSNPVTPSPHMYSDDGRDLAFGDRMY
ncbi:hypothetical protein QBC43DRAFT_127673 [Cladorrhinum sp. PSN259]|nr:hypothetical protein QBC43DRAFT_127673 [Cladorrhinum sp. PSN259]